MEQMIPIFMCKAPDETREFYQALGFEVTYWQDQPYVYGAVSRGEINFSESRKLGHT